MHNTQRNQDIEQRLEAAEHAGSATALKARATAVAALVMMIGLLAFSLAPMAQAQKGGAGGNSLEARVTALESTNAAQAQQISQLQSDNASLQARLAILEDNDGALGNRVTSLETKTAPLSVAGTDFIVSGMNVHIVDGTGSTQSTSGLGNLTIGYNALRNVLGYPDVRTGSHNLILGDGNNYSSFGGLVVGRWNAISGRYASVSGGEVNTASGTYASVSGGHYHTASGPNASVSGGYYNTASDHNASVSGGYFNTASGPNASVSGGGYNTASGYASSVSGGEFGSATAYGSWVAGSLFQDP
jgi:uncharacterized coiled-coil protein SlyX